MDLGTNTDFENFTVTLDTNYWEHRRNSMLILLFEVIWLLLNQATFFLIQISFSIHGEWILKWPIDTKIQTCSSTLYNAHNLPNWPIKIISNHLLVNYCWIHCKLLCKPSMMAHTCNLSTLEVESGGSQVWSQPGLHSQTLKKKRDEIWGGEIERTEEENENRKKGGKEKMEREKISKE